MGGGYIYVTYLERLFILQKRAVRIICNASFLAHTDPLFYSKKILKIFDIHKFRLAIYMYQNHSTEFSSADHSYNTRFRHHLVPEFHRLNSSQRSLDFSAPHFWNSLPEYIKQADSINIFKRRVKEYLLEQYLI